MTGATTRSAGAKSKGLGFEKELRLRKTNRYIQRMMRGWLFGLVMLILGAVFWGSPLFVPMLVRYHQSQAAYGTEWTNEGVRNFIEMYAAGIATSIFEVMISKLFSWWETSAQVVLLLACGAALIASALFVAAIVSGSSELKTYFLYLIFAAFPAGIGYGLFFLLRAPHMSVNRSGFNALIFLVLANIANGFATFKVFSEYAQFADQSGYELNPQQIICCITNFCLLIGLASMVVKVFRGDFSAE